MADPTLLHLARAVTWPGFTGRTAPSWLLAELDGGLAGAVYFAHNIDPRDPDRLSGLSASIHDANPEALIGIDEEGGDVTRLQAETGSSSPGNALLGRLDDPATTEDVAGWLGRLVAAGGIDVDLAPAVDVNANPANPVIGTRSFSADPDIASRHAAATVRGIQAARVAACAKHFPGHGDTAADSHVRAAVSDVDETTLHEVHLPPFAAAIAAGVKALMCAHIRVPFLGEAPATVNPAALALARDMGFDGVMITDALDMAAIRDSYGSGPGAVAALRAGADLLCTGNPFGNSRRSPGADEREYVEVRDAAYFCLASGELPVERVEEAAERNRRLARWTAGSRPGVAPAGLDGTAIAARGIEAVGAVDVSGPLTVIDARPTSMAVGHAPDFVTAALRRRTDVDRLEVAGRSADAAAASASEALAGSSRDTVVIVSAPESDPVQAAVLRAVHARAYPVVVHTGWPDDGCAERTIFTFGGSSANAEAAASFLFDRG